MFKLNKAVLFAVVGAAIILILSSDRGEPAQDDSMLGLPPVPAPENNPITSEKVTLGEKLFNDTRFSKTGEVSCSTCHDAGKAFTDSPLRVSEGIHDLRGTRNAPTVINAAYMTSQFWDGREPDLEGQSKQPFLNPVEMGLESHDPILEIVQNDSEYTRLFKDAFGVSGNAVTMDHVAMAIATFERTIVSGNSPFDRWWFGGDDSAVDESVKRGLTVFLNQGRCVSCHTITETHALFTDGKFHNLNVGFNQLAGEVREAALAFVEAKRQGTDVDVAVLTNPKTSELGRYAVTSDFEDIGAFKTPTLRNVARTAPYMHDGSLATLEDVVTFYNLGGRETEEEPINDFQSSGIKPLDLSEQQQADLVAFMEALTSPQFQETDNDE